MNPLSVFRRLVLLLPFFFMTPLQAQMAVPPKLQAAIFQKIFTYDHALAGNSRLIVVFPDKSPGQRDEIYWPSAFGHLDMTYGWDGGRQQIQLTPFGRSFKLGGYTLAAPDGHSRAAGPQSAAGRLFQNPPGRA